MTPKSSHSPSHKTHLSLEQLERRDQPAGNIFDVEESFDNSGNTRPEEQFSLATVENGIRQAFAWDYSNIFGHSALVGKAKGASPTVGINIGSDLNIYNIDWKSKEVIDHPKAGQDLETIWTSPKAGMVNLQASLRDAHSNWGDGVTYRLELRTPGQTALLAQGDLADGASATLAASTHLYLNAGDQIVLVLNAKATKDGDHIVEKIKIDYLEEAQKTSHVSVLAESMDTQGKLSGQFSARLGTGSGEEAFEGQYNYIMGDADLLGQARGDSPFYARNISAADKTLYNILFKKGELVVHPSAEQPIILLWESKHAGIADLDIGIEDRHLHWGNGGRYKVELRRADGTTSIIAEGMIDDGAKIQIPKDTGLNIGVGDKVAVIVSSKGRDGVANKDGDIFAVNMKMTVQPVVETEQEIPLLYRSLFVEDFTERKNEIRARFGQLNVPVSPEMKTPVMTITARRAVLGNLLIDTTDVPAGWVVDFGGVRVAVPSNGSVELPLSSFAHSDRRTYKIQLLRGDGSVALENGGEFGVMNGRHTYPSASYSYDPGARWVMTNLAYDATPLLPGEIRDEVMALRAELAEIETEEALLAAEDARLERLDAQLVRDRRESAVAIPVLQQLIADLTVQVPQLLTLKQQATANYEATRTRWGVTAEEINAAHYAEARAHSAWEIATNRLASAQRALSGAIAGFQGHSPERDVRPEMSIVGVNGHQLVVEVAHMQAGASVEVRQDVTQPPHEPMWQGVINQAVSLPQAGEHSSFVSLAFHAGLPTGIYQVRLINAGAPIQTETFYVEWNQSARTVSLIGDTFFQLGDLPAVDGLTVSSTEVTDVRTQALQQAAAIAPTYTLWNPSYAGTMRMLPEVIWARLGLNIDITTLQREIAHRMSPLHVAVSADGDAALKTQAMAGGMREEDFNYRRNWVMGDSYWEAQEITEKLQAGAAAYFSHLLRLRTGNTSQFDARSLEMGYAGAMTASTIMHAVESHFAECYQGLMHVKSEQDAMLAAQENASQIAGAAASKKAAQQRRVIASIAAIIASGKGIGTQEQRIANVLAAFPEAAQFLQAQIAGHQIITYRGEEVSEEIKIAVGGGMEVLNDNKITNPETGGESEATDSRFLGMQISNALSQTQAISFRDALTWYDGRTMFLPFTLTQDTPVTRIFLGTLQRLREADYGMKIDIAKLVERITLIPYNKIILAETIARNDSADLAKNLRSLFTAAGHGHIFQDIQSDLASVSFASSAPSIPAAQRKILQMHIRHAENGIVQGEDILVRYDLQANGTSLSHVHAYLIDKNGKQLGEALTAEIRGLGLIIPQSVIRQRLRDEGYTSDVNKIQIKLAAWFGSGEQAIGRISDGFYYDMSLSQADRLPGKYSTNPDLEQRVKEDAILSIIAANTPYKKVDGSWSMILASGYHDGHSFNAVDIGAGEADIGKEVLAVDGGVISSIDLSFGTIVIDHPAGKNNPAWQSKYLHQPLYKTSETSPLGGAIYVSRLSDKPNAPVIKIWIGKEVTARDPIGIISGRGRPSQKQIDAGTVTIVGVDEEGKSIADDAFDEHIHFEALLDGNAINLGTMIKQAWKIPIYGADQGTATVTWSTAIDIGNQGGAWVNNDLKLIFFRHPDIQNDPENDIWLAWEPNIPVANMKKVVWINNLPDGTVVKGWLNSTNFSQQWDPLRQEFFSR